MLLYKQSTSKSFSILKKGVNTKKSFCLVAKTAGAVKNNRKKGSLARVRAKIVGKKALKTEKMVAKAREKGQNLDSVRSALIQI